MKLRQELIRAYQDKRKQFIELELCHTELSAQHDQLLAAHATTKANFDLLLFTQKKAADAKQEMANVWLTGKITKREKQVLDLMSVGDSSREIGIKLFLSKKTIDKHRANLIKKLGSKNSVGLGRWINVGC